MTSANREIDRAAKAARTIDKHHRFQRHRTDDNRRHINLCCNLGSNESATRAESTGNRHLNEERRRSII
ncbi:hypothetical protein N9A81_02490 [Synechococcus sp. AH-707-M23]|nr:hypothetical protein [Synechococcus sp. AH-707-M23]